MASGDIRCHGPQMIHQGLCLDRETVCIHLAPRANGVTHQAFLQAAAGCYLGRPGGAILYLNECHRLNAARRSGKVSAAIAAAL